MFPHQQLPPGMPPHYPMMGVGMPLMAPMASMAAGQPLPSSSAPFPEPPLAYATGYSEEAMREQRCLPPPPVPSRFTVYGEAYDLSAPLLPSLGELGIAQAYSPTGRWKDELKRLNRSAVAAFMDLLNILIDSPASPERLEKMEAIRLLFINTHHLLNEYRVVQARATLREMIVRQNREIKAVCERLQVYIAAGNGALERIRTTLQELDFDESALPKSPLHEPATRDDLGGDEKGVVMSEEIVRNEDANSDVVMEGEDRE